MHKHTHVALSDDILFRCYGVATRIFKARASDHAWCVTRLISAPRYHVQPWPHHNRRLGRRSCNALPRITHTCMSQLISYSTTATSFTLASHARCLKACCKPTRQMMNVIIKSHRMMLYPRYYYSLTHFGCNPSHTTWCYPDVNVFVSLLLQ